MAKNGKLPLQGMTAVVTAGGGAIGSATAGVLVRDGAHVVISGRTQEKLDRVCDSLAADAKEAGGSIIGHAANGTDEDQIRELVAVAEKVTGRIDMAANVVGGGGGSTAPILRYTVDMLEGTFRQNITSAYL